MNTIAMGFENIANAHGITLSIVGMLIVFLALAIIATFITMVSKFLPLLEKVFPEVHPHPSPSSSHSADHEEVMAAIAYALFLKETGSLPNK